MSTIPSTKGKSSSWREGEGEEDEEGRGTHVRAGLGGCGGGHEKGSKEETEEREDGGRGKSVREKFSLCSQHCTAQRGTT